MSKTRGKNPPWDAAKIKALRTRLGLSQQAMAQELGTRQQTISEWETGYYAPRGMSSGMLNLLAERADSEYGTQSAKTANKTGQAQEP